MGREGISDYSEIMKCQVLDKYNLTDRKVPAITIKNNKWRNSKWIVMLDPNQWKELPPKR